MKNPWFSIEERQPEPGDIITAEVVGLKIGSRYKSFQVREGEAFPNIKRWMYLNEDKFDRWMELHPEEFE